MDKNETKTKKNHDNIIVFLGINIYIFLIGRLNFCNNLLNEDLAYERIELRIVLCIFKNIIKMQFEKEIEVTSSVHHQIDY